MATQADLYNIEPAAAGAAEVAPEPAAGAHQRRRPRRQNVAVDGAKPGRGEIPPEVPSRETGRNRRRNVPGGTENVKPSAKRTAEAAMATTTRRRMAMGMTGRLLLGTVLVTALVTTLLVMLATLDATWIW
uniref:(northern house mosquito) hypothetical protein n=1 Tax=Culex pipiens TaxID=7175 RepID=A0A8D8MNZ4_CULPI